VKQPRLKRTIERIDVPEGDVILMRACADDVRVENPNGSERELLTALDGSRSVADLEDRFGARLVGETLATMGEFGLIEDAADEERLEPATRERFDRQLRYFGDVACRGGATPAECQLRLECARIAVLGVGGLGGRTAMELASIGVGELWLADGDRVETSNLNRQTQYTEADVGNIKVEAMAARLRSFNSATTVRTSSERLESEEQIGDFIAGADIVIDSADWPTHEIERWCNSACFAAGIPYIAMSHFPPIARVGPLYVPGETGCFACQETEYRRDYPLYDMAVEQRRAKPLPAGTFGPACGLTGGLVATEVMHFLTGITPPRTLGAGYTMDLRSFELDRYEVTADPGCQVCGGISGTPGSTTMEEPEAVGR
jgi:bacteriocin biosynthesis cyclodehydratase domain-containing protein